MTAPAPAPAAGGKLVRSFCLGLLALTLGVHLFCATRGWRNPPVDGHEFRQAQTALTIRYLARGGFRLDYPTPLLGKPWSIPLEFPLHQGLAAALDRHTALDAAAAGRLVALAFFYLSLPALWLLARRLVPGPGALLVPALVLASPLYLFYSRTVLIESTALCLSLWFLWFHWSALASRRLGPALAATACGALAAMVKLPTFCAFLAPAAFVLLRELRPSVRRPALILLAGAMVGLSFAAGLGWSAYADGVKRLNPLAESLLSTSQRAWATGELALRLDPGLWSAFAHTTAAAVVGTVGLLALAGVTILARPALRWCIWLLLLCFLTPLLVFANVYRIHDYYYFANGVFLLAALGVGLAGWLGEARWKQFIAAALACAVVALGWSDYSRGYYGLIPGPEHRQPELGRALQAVTAPDDVIVIIGHDWNPVLPYLADRRALMLPFPREHDPASWAAALAGLAGEKVGALVVAGPRRTQHHLFRPVIARFNLADAPVLVGDFNDLYIPATAAAASSGLRNLRLMEHHVNRHDYGGTAARVPVPAGAYPRFSPAPREVAAEFGIGPVTLGDHTVLGAHPDCDLVFTLPPGARRLRAGFGLFAGAYEGTAGQTDGVQFSVILHTPDGAVQVLRARLLTPATTTEDRGPQEIEVALPAHSAGDLILRTDPGPAGNRSFDWAYWSFATIE